MVRSGVIGGDTVAFGWPVTPQRAKTMLARLPGHGDALKLDAASGLRLIRQPLVGWCYVSLEVSAPRVLRGDNIEPLRALEVPELLIALDRLVGRVLPVGMPPISMAMLSRVDWTFDIRVDDPFAFISNLGVLVKAERKQAERHYWEVTDGTEVSFLLPGTSTRVRAYCPLFKGRLLGLRKSRLDPVLDTVRFEVSNRTPSLRSKLGPDRTFSDMARYLEYGASKYVTGVLARYANPAMGRWDDDLQERLMAVHGRSAGLRLLGYYMACLARGPVAVNALWKLSRRQADEYRRDLQKAGVNFGEIVLCPRSTEAGLN